MRPILWIFALALLGTVASAPAAQHTDTTSRHYRWVDAGGLPHYSDTLSIKALRHGYDVLGTDGRVIRHVARETATATHVTQRRIDPHQSDRQLLMAYPTEADFKAAQQAHIEQFDRQLRTTRMNLDSQETNLAQLLGHAADFSRQGKPVPHSLDQRIGKQRKTVDTQRELLEHLQTKRAAAQKEAAARLTHYRELQAHQKARYGH